MLPQRKNAWKRERYLRRPLVMRSYLQHWGRENHFKGKDRPPFLESTIRAKLGVICNQLKIPGLLMEQMNQGQRNDVDTLKILQSHLSVI